MDQVPRGLADTKDQPAALLQAHVRGPLDQRVRDAMGDAGRRSERTWQYDHIGEAVAARRRRTGHVDLGIPHRHLVRSPAEQHLERIGVLVDPCSNASSLRPFAETMRSTWPTR